MASTDSAVATVAATKPTKEEKPAAAVAADAADDAAPPPKVEMPNRTAFEAEVDALKRLMATNKAQKSTLFAKMESNKTGGSTESVSINSDAAASDRDFAVPPSPQVRLTSPHRLDDLQKAFHDARDHQKAIR